jgi:hypothetical protein
LSLPPLATFIFTCKSEKTEEEAYIVSGHTTAGKAKKRKKGMVIAGNRGGCSII